MNDQSLRYTGLFPNEPAMFTVMVIQYHCVYGFGVRKREGVAGIFCSSILIDFIP